MKFKQIVFESSHVFNLHVNGTVPSVVVVHVRNCGLAD